MKQGYFFLFILFSFPLALKAGPSATTPIHFIENKGQWDAPFKYRAQTGKGDVFLLPDEFVYVIGDYANLDKMEAYHHGLVREPQVLKFHEYRMVFEGANVPEITGSKEQKTY